MAYPLHLLVIDLETRADPVLLPEPRDPDAFPKPIQHEIVTLGFLLARIERDGQGERYAIRKLGAASIVDRATLSAPGKPFQKERWAAVVDAVGSHTLTNAIAQTRYGGTVAACGLAQGMDLPTTVMPFILRGVALIGVDSVMAPRAARQRAWDRLAQDLDLAKLDRMIDEVPVPLEKR